MKEDLPAEHRCDALPETGVAIVYATFESDGLFDGWNLLITEFATEQHLEENPYLENVGDTIWQTILQVHHCPYCGDKLLPSQAFQTPLMSHWHTLT